MAYARDNQDLYDPTQRKNPYAQQGPPPNQTPYSTQQPNPFTNTVKAVQTPLAPAYNPQSATPAQQAATTPWNRTAFRDSWMSTGNNVGAQDALLKQYGITGMSGNGTVTLPSGEIMDLRIGARAGQNQAGWTGVGEMHNGVASYYPQGGAQGGGMGSSFSASSGGGANAANVDPELRAALLRLMGRSEPGAIDPTTDPNLAPQAAAYRVARQRALQQERGALAERAAAEGLNSGGAGSGAFDTGVQGGLEKAGEDTAQYNAGLVGQEVQARRNDLMNALQLANSIGARDSAQKIQMQLAQLDNQYRYAALAQNQGQFADTFGLQRDAYLRGLDRDAYYATRGGNG